jgi:hypothetical protein
MKNKKIKNPYTSSSKFFVIWIWIFFQKISKISQIYTRKNTIFPYIFFCGENNQKKKKNYWKKNFSGAFIRFGIFFSQKKKKRFP